MIFANVGDIAGAWPKQGKMGPIPGRRRAGGLPEMGTGLKARGERAGLLPVRGAAIPPDGRPCAFRICNIAPRSL